MPGLPAADSFEILARYTSDALVVTDAEGRTLWVNHAFEKMSGYALDALRGRRPGQVLQGAGTDAATVARLRAAIAAGEPADVVLLNYAADGRAYWTELHVEPVTGPGGAVRYFVGTQRDVTARRAVERELALKAAVFEHMGEAVNVALADRTIVLTNPACDAMFGVPRGALIGRSYEVLSPQPTEWHAELLRAVTERVRAEGCWRGELDNVRADGRPMRTRATITFIDHEGMRYGIAVRSDITRLRQLEREVLEAAERERRQLAQELHDGLGQELAAIAFMLGPLQQRAERGEPIAPESIARVADATREALRKSRALARSVSAFTIGQQGLGAALADLAALVADRFGLEVAFDCAAEVVASVPADLAHQVYRIVQEAITNAVRHGDCRRVSVRVAAGGGSLAVTIDNDGAPLEAGAGSGGMGLSSMRYRATAHGGRLDVRNREEGGVRVTAVFPWPVPGAPARVSEGARAT